MVSESLITKIVNDTLDEHAPRASWDQPNTMALTFGFKLSVPRDLEGHRTLEVVSDLYTVAEFTEMCEAGHLIDYDGVGYFSTETTESDELVSIAEMAHGGAGIDPQYTHVRWYNR